MKYLFLLTAGLVFSYYAKSQGCTVNYTAPSFQLTKTDPGCSDKSGRIDVVNLKDGLGPFKYTLIELGISNSTGVFTNLPGGTYTVELRDDCGTVRTRQVTLVPYQFSFDYTITKLKDGCNEGEVSISVNSQGGTFDYGIAIAGQDTIWNSKQPFVISLNKNMTILVRDACGNLEKKIWTAPQGFLPYIKELQYRLQCDKVDIFPLYYGFTDPTVCLYNLADNKLIACKSAKGSYTGGVETNFFDVPYGIEYYVIVQDACSRDSMFFPNMESVGGSEVNPYNWDCNSFTMHVDGMEDTVCLYNAVTNQLISCKGQDTVSINPRTGVPWPSGAVWENLPYGSYYAWIYDPCMDSTFRIDSTVTHPFVMDVNTVPHCSGSKTTLAVNFDHATTPPYTIQLYYPDGSLAKQVTSTTTSNNILFNTYPGGGMLTVVASDGCGNSKSTTVEQEDYSLTKNAELVQKCPGLNGSSGSADLTITSKMKNGSTPSPTIIKFNGIDTLIRHGFFNSSNSSFLFPNLSTGVYQIKYVTFCEGLTIYDTVEVKDYVYPYQAALEVMQCGGNPVNFTAPTVGGLSPYTYQIISSVPSNPSLVSAVQSDSSFVVGTGVSYQSIRVRTIDRCGNSAIGDIVVSPIPTCDLVLPIDSIHKNPAIENLQVKVYPNPSPGPFTIGISQRKKSNFQIEIINASGIKLFEKMLSQVDQTNFTVNQFFVPGLYLVSITDLNSGKVSLFKQIIQSNQ